MTTLSLISASEVSSSQLEEIIKIKSTAWNYSFDKQIAWIKENLKDTDIHVLLSVDDKNIAYLNLIEIEIKIDGILKKGYGIGNVCTSVKNKGWGKEIIGKVNSYLVKNEKIGLLFCKKSLVDFYLLNNWKLIKKQKLNIHFNNELIETMYFNCITDFEHLEYSGTPF